jgi:hypothetical protein
MMGEKERPFAPLCNRSIEDFVPADNFYRHLDAKLDLSFVRAWGRRSSAVSSMENVPLPDLLRRTRFRWGLRPERAIADTAYATGENLRFPEEEGVRAYMPLADYETSSQFFKHAAFPTVTERMALGTATLAGGRAGWATYAPPTAHSSPP